MNKDKGFAIIYSVTIVSIIAVLLTVVTFLIANASKEFKYNTERVRAYNLSDVAIEKTINIINRELEGDGFQKSDLFSEQTKNPRNFKETSYNINLLNIKEDLYIFEAVGKANNTIKRKKVKITINQDSLNNKFALIKKIEKYE